MKRSRASIPFEALTMRATDDNRKIFHGYDDEEKGAWLGACFDITALVGANQGTVDSLVSALSMPLPAGSVVQFGLLAHPDASDALHRYRQNKHGATGLRAELIKRHHDLYAGSVDTPLIPQSNVMLNQQEFFMTMKVPASFNPQAAEINAVQVFATQMVESVSATGMQLQQLHVHQYMRLLEILHDPWGSHDGNFNELMPLREQIYGPADGIDFQDPKTMNFHGGRFFAKALSVKKFPPRAALASMGRITGDPGGLLNQITDPYYMVTTIRYPDQVDTTANVIRKAAIINHQAFGPMLKLSPVLGYKKEGFDILVDELSGQGGVACEINFTIFLFSRDKERLAGLSAGMQSYYGALKYKLQEDQRILKTLWNELLPLNTSSEGVKNLHRFHTMGVKHACQFLPIIGEWTGTTSASLLYVTRHGQPATLDLYDSNANYNAYVCATSGAGKSYLTQGIIRDYLAEGAKVWAIDNGDSYFKLNKMVNGEHIEFSSESAICLNPFTHVIDLDEDMDVLKATHAKMAAPKDGLDDHQMAILEQAITSVWQKYGTAATPSAVAQWCQEQQNNAAANRIATQLFPFTNGSYARWFNGPNTLNMDNDFVLLELQHLKARKELQQVVLLQIMARISHDMFMTKSRRKILIVDEAWEQLDDPLMEKALAAIYRKARKNEGSIIVVTQAITDLSRSENSKAILSNSTFSFILAQEPAAIDEAIASKAISIDPYGVHLMKSVHTVPGRYSEVLVRRGSQYSVFRNVVDEFTNITFSTKGPAFASVMSAMLRGTEPVDAVKDYMRRAA